MPTVIRNGHEDCSPATGEAAQRHAEAAEALLARANEGAYHPGDLAPLMAMAQVHATLALRRDDRMTEGMTPIPEWRPCTAFMKYTDIWLRASWGCSLEAGHVGVHRSHNGLAWADDAPSVPDNPRWTTNESDTWWLEGVEYQVVRDSTGGVVAYAFEDSATLIVTSVNAAREAS